MCLTLVQCHWEAALIHHWPDLVHAFPTTTTTLDCQFSFWKLFHFGRISSSAISTDQRLSQRHPSSHLWVSTTLPLRAADYCCC